MSEASQCEKTPGVDISVMLTDINKVLHQHLTNILTPMLKEKQNIQQLLLNMPMVKQLQEEHFKLQKIHFAMSADAKAMKLFYESELRAKVQENHILKNEFQNLKTKFDEVVKNLKNVTLEVKEISKPNTPPLNIQNDSFKKNEKVTSPLILRNIQC